MITRRQKLKAVSSARAKKLQESLAWQNFRRDCNEVSDRLDFMSVDHRVKYISLQVGDWIHEKLTVASDESYRDPTNLQSKLQKHQAFEAELATNKGRVDTVCKVHVYS